MTKVKICGNTNAEDARLACSLGADYLGLIFAESKRKVTISMASSILGALPHFKNFVGVFANQSKKEVEVAASELGLKILQFHGDETALYCHSFLDKGYQVIKTFRVKDKMSLKRIDEYNVTAFLLDTYVKDKPGGTGIPFDWGLLKDRPFILDKLFLAGGLNIHNLGNAIDTLHPYAVDVVSGVEREPGKKNPELLQAFIRLAKEGRRERAQKDSLHS